MRRAGRAGLACATSFCVLLGAAFLLCSSGADCRLCSCRAAAREGSRLAAAMAHLCWSTRGHTAVFINAQRRRTEANTVLLRCCPRPRVRRQLSSKAVWLSTESSSTGWCAPRTRHFQNFGQLKRVRAVAHVAPRRVTESAGTPTDAKTGANPSALLWALWHRSAARFGAPAGRVCLTHLLLASA